MTVITMGVMARILPHLFGGSSLLICSGISIFPAIGRIKVTPPDYREEFFIASLQTQRRRLNARLAVRPRFRPRSRFSKVFEDEGPFDFRFENQ
jgi:hypothetical protein